MKAALLLEPGNVVVQEVEDPVPGPGEVRIAVSGVGLCGSDVSVFSGRWKAPSYPWIMGHEAFGIIESVGPGVSSDRIGQTVVVEPNAACSACPQCERGWTSACAGRQSLGMNRQGALAELLVVPDRTAWQVADGLAVTDLVCAEPTTVVLAALRRLGGPLPGEAVVVGVGAQGLLMSVALMARGVSVYVHDVNEDRVAFAAELGAAPLPTDGRVFGLAVDTVGSPASTATSIEHLEVGGTLLCLGLDSRPLDLTAQTVVRRQLVIRGSLTYDHPVDFAASTEVLGEGVLRPGRTVTDEYSLLGAQAAFERSGSSRGKTWVNVDASR